MSKNPKSKLFHYENHFFNNPFSLTINSLRNKRAFCPPKRQTLQFAIVNTMKKLLTSISLNDILDKKVEKLYLLVDEITKEDRRKEEIPIIKAAST